MEEILDLQAMDDAPSGHGGGHGGSSLSLLLCDSTASVAACL